MDIDLLLSFLGGRYGGVIKKTQNIANHTFGVFITKDPTDLIFCELIIAVLVEHDCSKNECRVEFAVFGGGTGTFQPDWGPIRDTEQEFTNRQILQQS